jgi:hypothetical protein
MVTCARHSRHTAFTTQPITFTRGADDAGTPHTQNNIPPASAIASSKKIQNSNTCSPIPLLPCPTCSRPRPTLCCHGRCRSPAPLPFHPFAHVTPFAPAPTDITPHHGSCIRAFVVQLLRARRDNRQLPRASTKEHFTRVAAGSTGQRVGIKYNGNLLAVNAQTHTRTTLHTLLLRSSSTQAAQRWKEVPAPHRYDFRRPTRRAFSRRVAAAF